MKTMIKNKMPALGKITPEVFDEVIYPNLGAKNSGLIVGPRHGVDCAIVDTGGDSVMAITCDPFYIVPQYGFEKAAWFAFHILASDISTTGLAPSYVCVDLNLPPVIKEEEFKLMWESFSRECWKYGVAIAGGHTAKYAGCNYPMVGGAFMCALGKKGGYVVPSMAREGDLLIITKGAAVEASALMAATFPDKIEKAFGRDFLFQAQKMFYDMSVLEDALTASSCGLGKNGVTAMHDATECGVYGGIFELARASGKGVKLYKDKIHIDERASKICELFGMDPYSSISEGTLILTTGEAHAQRVIKRLSDKGIEAFICAQITAPEKGMVLSDKGSEKELKHPIIDPFWDAFEKAMKESKPLG